MIHEKKEWNARATDDAYHWVVTSKRDWDTEEYYKTGKVDVQKYIVPIISSLHTPQMTALDVGCGTGRMTRYMADIFKKVIGTDVSEGMIARARQDNPTLDFFATGPDDLLSIQSDSVDFVFSYATIQHIPEKRSVKKLIAEIRRVLREGGTAHFDVRINPGGAAGRFLWKHSFNTFYIGIMLWHRYIPIPYVRAFDSLFGAFFSPKELVRTIEALGFKIIKTDRTNKRSLWITARKI